MTESKGKSTKAAKVEKNENVEKPAKKPRTKTTASKIKVPVEENKKVSVEETASVVAEVSEPKEVIAEDAKAETASEPTEEKKEKKTRTVKAEVEPEAKPEVEPKVNVERKARHRMKNLIGMRLKMKSFVHHQNSPNMRICMTKLFQLLQLMRLLQAL